VVAGTGTIAALVVVTTVVIIVEAAVTVMAVATVVETVVVTVLVLPLDLRTRINPSSLLLMLLISSGGLARVWLLMALALAPSKWVAPLMFLAVNSSAARSLPSLSPLVPLVSHAELSVARMVSAALSLAGSPRLPVLASDVPLATIVRLVSSLRSGVIKR